MQAQRMSLSQMAALGAPHLHDRYSLGAWPIGKSAPDGTFHSNHRLQFAGRRHHDHLIDPYLIDFPFLISRKRDIITSVKLQAGGLIWQTL
jgi:hypothetical protein